MKTAAWALTLMLALLLSALASTAYFGNAQATSNVSGIINTNTTWTKANSPYTLTGNVLVDNKVTLTIEPGTTVNLEGYYIMVNGTLKAKGTSANPIMLNGGSIDLRRY
jgi:hypothetical protein